MTLPHLLPVYQPVHVSSVSEIQDGNGRCCTPAQIECEHLEHNLIELQDQIQNVESNLYENKGLNHIREAFADTRERFRNFEMEVQNSGAFHAKEASMMDDPYHAHEEVILTRIRFLKIHTVGCERYYCALLNVLSRSAAHGMKPKRRLLSNESKQFLVSWFNENRNSPFPSKDQKRRFATQLDVPVEQITIWFSNARARRGPNAEVAKKRRRTHREARRAGLPGHAMDDSDSMDEE